MESITRGQDWLCFSDLIQQRVQHDQDFMLRKYSVFLPVAFHMLFAKATPLKLQYTNVSYEVSYFIKISHSLINKQTSTTTFLCVRWCPLYRGSTVSTLELILKKTTKQHVFYTLFLFFRTWSKLKPTNKRYSWCSTAFHRTFGEIVYDNRHFWSWSRTSF